MGNKFELNRLEFNILKCLYDSGCIDPYHSMTISEILEKHNVSDKRMTVYKKLSKLTKEKYIKKGVLDNHADTFFLLEKGNRIVENKDSSATIRQIKDRSTIPYDNNSVRDKLINIMERGLLLKSIAVNAGLSESELSRFKNGMNSLKEFDVKLLAEYLNEVNIPIWNNKEPEETKPKKKKSTRDLLFLN